MTALESRLGAICSNRWFRTGDDESAASIFTRMKTEDPVGHDIFWERHPHMTSDRIVNSRKVYAETRKNMRLE